jgi:hypothetical protein
MLAKAFVALAAVALIGVGGYVFWDDLVGNQPADSQAQPIQPSTSCCAEADEPSCSHSPCCTDISRAALLPAALKAIEEGREIAPQPREIVASE